MEKKYFKEKGSQSQSSTDPSTREKNNKEKNTKKIALIVQARTSSSRLPGKVLLPVMGRPLLEYLIERLQRVKYPVELIVATSSEHSDTPIVTLCQSLGVRTFQGDLENVLSRYGQAASEVKADIIVRITADCPLIDPKVVDHLIAQFLQHYPNVDYMSNTLKRTFPRGMDTEVFTYQALQVALERAKSAYDQEHVTPYFYTHPDQFRLMNIETSPDHSNISLVVDTPEDFVRINAILRTIYPKDPEFTYQTVLETLDSDR